MTDPTLTDSPLPAASKAWPVPLRLPLALLLAACFCLFAFWSRHWEWMNDEQVFRYTQLLMGRGLAPYRQITDINLPGSYLFEFLATHLFGASDLGFRLYEYTLLLGLTLAATWIARPYDWFAGLFAGVSFALIHGAEGPLQAGERDEVMTVLLLLGFAFAFAAVRRHRPALFFFATLAIVLSTTLKPTALLFGLWLLAVALLALRKARTPLRPYLLGVVVATLLLVLALATFFLWRDSFPAFLHTILPLVGSYSAGERLPLSTLLRHGAPLGLFLLLPLGLVLFFSNRSWRRPEVLAVAGGAALGLLSYVAQGKGYPYHRYPFIAFALLWCALECAIALRGRFRWAQLVGLAGLLLGSLGMAALYLPRVPRADTSNTVAHSIMDDLRAYPPSSLEGRVQCLDGLDGCYSALYRLDLRQSTGLMGDHLLFSDRPAAPALALRRQTLGELEAHPPQVIVLTNFWYGHNQSFRKLGNFPELASFLQTRYDLLSQQAVTGTHDPDPDTPAYRIYRLRSRP